MRTRCRRHRCTPCAVVCYTTHACVVCVCVCSSVSYTVHPTSFHFSPPFSLTTMAFVALDHAMVREPKFKVGDFVQFDGFQPSQFNPSGTRSDIGEIVEHFADQNGFKVN